MQGNEEKPVKGYTEPIPNGKSATAMREESILAFWKDNDTFNKSLTKDAPKGNYVFYDGPPFATGLPHYGHILGSTAKDVIGRYQTMQGFRVPRRWGWDCHGLPIENIVEKELGISGKKAIEEYGIEKFTEFARSKVLTYVAEWEKTVDRIGRWVDFKHSYKTMDNTFIESVWWALSELNKKGLIYEGVRVLAYCPRCETPIANSEIAMDNSYKDITDISVYVKFECTDEPGTFFLAWTTTPWSLPGDTALAINKNITYVKVKVTTETGEESYILAKDRLSVVTERHADAEVVSEFSGEELVGKSYIPPFLYYKDADMPNKENIWKVWHADFVTTDKGTGIAHEAPAFGEEDMDLAKANNIPFIRHVAPDGRFMSEVTDFAGIKVKPKEDHQSTDILIIKHLAHQGSLFAKEKIIHSYPHCYRCDTPLLYYALPSWFVNIQNVKENVLAKGEQMEWIPSHLKEGRFKNTVASAPDWTISRNRYWASPLPIWKSASGKMMFIASNDELKAKTKRSGNTYLVMRHGESEHNLENQLSTTINIRDRLTEKGMADVAIKAKEYKDAGIDLIVCSPFMRTRMTAEIVAETIGYPKENILLDDRLHEISIPMYEGKTWKEYHADIPKTPEYFYTAPEGNESYADVKRRVMEALEDFERTYKGKKILIVTHGSPSWLMIAGAKGYKAEEAIDMIIQDKNFNYLGNADVAEVPFVPFPHNANYELDFHRPYIDSIVLVDDAGEEYRRIPEVIDCWFESGSMPFAQDHYPFERPNWMTENFPAGFVAEYIARTRTWFYYSHVLSTILFDHAPYQHVVTTGTILAEDGQKMSKSKNNFPDPWILFDKYGVDALRFYLMSSPVMKGEDVNFSEKLVQEIANKIVSRFDNVVSFYQLYRNDSLENETQNTHSENVLDTWILARLSETVREVSAGMEAYDMAEATRPLDGFLEDLSTWYLRRSRERLKDNDADAKRTLYQVLKVVARLLAPFTPFVAEDVWQKLKNSSDVESVHLAEWPKSEGAETVTIVSNILNPMMIARRLVSQGLQSRQEKGIKVRQPLSSLTVEYSNGSIDYQSFLSEQHLEIIKDEINIKNIFFIKTANPIAQELFFVDSKITEELKREGQYRELVRAVQDMRKKADLNPSDLISLTISTNVAGQELLNEFEVEFAKVVGAREIKIAETEGVEVKIDDLTFVIAIS